LTVFPRLDFDYLEVSLRLIKELIRLATKAENEAVRVAAIKEMLDRGFGKATQPVEGSLTYGISNQLAELFRGNERNTLGAEIARRALLAPNAQHQVSRAGLDCWHAPSHPMQYRQRNDGVRAW